jgi:hypothetical protein
LVISSQGPSLGDTSNVNIIDACNTSTNIDHTHTIMVDEQEVPGASNSVDDAPSLQAARLSGRSRTATRRLLESQVQERSIRSKPKSKQQFNVYEEPATPPDTQVTINTSQEGTQQVIPSTSRPKKRLRAS